MTRPAPTPEPSGWADPGGPDVCPVLDLDQRDLCLPRVPVRTLAAWSLLLAVPGRGPGPRSTEGGHGRALPGRHDERGQLVADLGEPCEFGPYVTTRRDAP